MLQTNMQGLSLLVLGLTACICLAGARTLQGRYLTLLQDITGYVLHTSTGYYRVGTSHFYMIVQGSTSHFYRILQGRYFTLLQDITG